MIFIPRDVDCLQHADSVYHTPSEDAGATKLTSHYKLLSFDYASSLYINKTSSFT